MAVEQRGKNIMFLYRIIREFCLSDYDVTFDIRDDFSSSFVLKIFFCSLLWRWKSKFCLISFWSGNSIILVNGYTYNEMENIFLSLLVLYFCTLTYNFFFILFLQNIFVCIFTGCSCIRLMGCFLHFFSRI